MSIVLPVMNHKKKKNRGYVRKLEQQLRALEADKNHLLGILNYRVMRTDELASSLSAVRNRIRRLNYVHLVDLRQLGVRSYEISTNDIKKKMVEEFLHNEQFLDLIKFELDDSFVGVGSRYILSIEILTPE